MKDFHRKTRWWFYHLLCCRRYAFPFICSFQLLHIEVLIVLFLIRCVRHLPCVGLEAFFPILILFGLQTVILLRIWDLCKVLMDVHLIQPFVKAKEKQYLFLWWHSGALKHSGHCVSVIAFNKSNSLLSIIWNHAFIYVYCIYCT